MRIFCFITAFMVSMMVLMECGQPEVKKNTEERTATTESDSLRIDFPSHFPKPNIPSENYFTEDRVALGKEIFFSTVFSYDGKISCASCHIPELAFADTAIISKGVNGRKGFRNSPSLVNIAWHAVFMLDGGVPTLEMQALAPFSGHDEMDFSLSQAVEILNNDKELTALSKKAYNRIPDAYVITSALACYQRTLFDGNSRYDTYVIDSVANPLSASEKKGMQLFFSEKTGCASCHGGMLFSDYTYQNIGLYEHYADSGRSRITLRVKDSGKFKVPSLRNVSVTAPYMHDGSLKTLEEVVRFYETGGKKHVNKSHMMKKFTLTNEERAALVDFLKTLTGNTFTNDV
ncbi:MAG: cytochrome-c peroxidase [Flavobacteriales bacterium]